MKLILQKITIGGIVLIFVLLVGYLYPLNIPGYIQASEIIPFSELEASPTLTEEVSTAHVWQVGIIGDKEKKLVAYPSNCMQISGSYRWLDIYASCISTEGSDNTIAASLEYNPDTVDFYKNDIDYFDSLDSEPYLIGTIATKCNKDYCVDIAMYNNTVLGVFRDENYGWFIHMNISELDASKVDTQDDTIDKILDLAWLVISHAKDA